MSHVEVFGQFSQLIPAGREETTERSAVLEPFHPELVSQQAFSDQERALHTARYAVVPPSDGNIDQFSASDCHGGIVHCLAAIGARDLSLRYLRFVLFKNCFLLLEGCLQRAGQALKSRVHGVGLILEHREATKTFEQKVTKETKNSRTVTLQPVSVIWLEGDSWRPLPR